MGRGWRKPAINPMNQDQEGVPGVPSAAAGLRGAVSWRATGSASWPQQLDLAIAG